MRVARTSCRPVQKKCLTAKTPAERFHHNVPPELTVGLARLHNHRKRVPSDDGCQWLPDRQITWRLGLLFDRNRVLVCQRLRDDEPSVTLTHEGKNIVVVEAQVSHSAVRSLPCSGKVGRFRHGFPRIDRAVQCRPLAWRPSTFIAAIGDREHVFAKRQARALCLWRCADSAGCLRRDRNRCRSELGMASRR